MDIISELIANISTTEFRNLPSDVVDATKKCILDTLGVAIAGTTAFESNIVASLVKDWGGKKESTIFVHGGRVPSPNATLANCTMARALDLDDCHEVTLVHPDCVAVPAAFAIAEREGKIGGKDIITAVALGSDLVNRMQMACDPIDGKRLVNFTLSPFGAAAVAGKILGLDEDKMVGAMGIALEQSSGTRQTFFDGAPTVGSVKGLGAKAGIVSALLAQKGLAGPTNVLQGRDGFFARFNLNRYNGQILTADLGKRFEGVNVSIKQFPSCKGAHSATVAALDLVHEHPFSPEDVDEIIVQVNQNSYNLLCDPLDTKRNPPTITHAKFSIPYNVGVAVVKQKVFIDDFTMEAIRSPDVLKISNKVKPLVDPQLNRRVQNGIPASVEIRLRNGSILSKYVETVKGHPRNPMSMKDCIEKFEKCAGYSAKPIVKENLEEVIKMVSNLEKVSDVAEITELLVS